MRQHQLGVRVQHQIDNKTHVGAPAYNGWGQAFFRPAAQLTPGAPGNHYLLSNPAISPAARLCLKSLTVQRLIHTGLEPGDRWLGSLGLGHRAEARCE